jgi:hypothetical protein
MACLILMMLLTGIGALVTPEPTFKALFLLNFGGAILVAFVVTLSKLFHDPEL